LLTMLVKLSEQLPRGCGSRCMTTFLLTKKASQNNEAWGDPLACQKKVVVLFALALVCMLASACRGKPASLEERVKEYWEVRIKGQAEQAYEFEAPGGMDKPTYLKKILASPVAFTAATVQSIKHNESGDEAEVELRVEFLLPGLSRSASSSMLDKWVKVRGRWYHMLPPAGEDGASPEERR